MDEEGEEGIGAGTGPDAEAVGIARHAAPAEEARAYLREQTELTRLRKENLLEQNAFELSHLCWGRLHLKWGEALTYAGNRPEAEKQFALASGLDLSTSDRVALAHALSSPVNRTER